MPINQHGFPFNGNVKLKEAALIYVEAGFSIIPLHWIAKNKCSCGRGDCASPAKHPITQHGLKDASNDPDQIRAWWKQYPKANIGVCTGQASNGLTVIDIDVAKGGNVRTVDIPITLEVETGAGFHFWLRSNQEIKNSAGKLGQGIDIRGWGGYVVAPPSVHSTGRIYAFRNQDPIADFPSEILAKLIEPNQNSFNDDEDLILSYEEPFIADVLPDGQRDELLASIAGTLRRQGFSKEEMEAALLVANQNRCKPPLNEKQVRKIAKSISRYAPAVQIPHGIEDESDLILDDDELDDIPIVDQSQKDQDSQTEQTGNPDLFPNNSGKDPLLGAMTADEFDLVVFGQSEMVLQGLYKGEWGLVIGIGSVGKTTLLLDICVALTAGRPFAPIIPAGNQPKRILFIDFEGPDFKLQKHVRLIRQALTPTENALVGKNLHLVVEPEIKGQPWRMTDRQSLLNLAAFIKQKQIDLVIVDTLSQAAQLRDENSNAEVQQKIVLPIRRLVRHCDVAMLMVHHEGRGKNQDGAHDTQYRGRGATSLMDASRYQISAIPADKNIREIIKVINSKNKGEGFEPVTLVLDKNTRWFSPGQVITPPPIEDLILDLLDTRSNPEGMTVAEIVAMLPGTPKRTMERKLAELVQAKQLISPKKGLYRPAPFPSDDDQKDDESSPQTPP